MTPLSNICTSQPLSERMRALGFEQDTQFFWVFDGIDDYAIQTRDLVEIFEGEQCIIRINKGRMKTVGCSKLIKFAAPTAGELGEVLKQTHYPLPLLNTKKKWFLPVNGWTIFEGKEWENEAEARGEMWCYLREQGLI